MSDLRVFVDAETSGTDAEGGDLLLELGAKVVTKQLDVVDELAIVIAQPGPILEWRILGNEVVREMHMKNGLLAEIKALGDPGENWAEPMMEAQTRFLYWLANHGFAADKSAGPAGGSTVHFDRRFLRQWMPKLDAMFTHRISDWSSTREQARDFRPDLTAGEPKAQKLHRVLPDIDDTLALARYYRTALFHASADCICDPGSPDAYEGPQPECEENGHAWLYSSDPAWRDGDCERCGTNVADIGGITAVRDA